MSTMLRASIRLLGSIRIAVPLIITIAVVLVAGTIYESRFGTAAVQRFIYQSWWFQTLLVFLAVNLAIVAALRWPWKHRHTPFLLAHLGIILMLIGAIIGGRFGVEGQLIIPEGQAERTLRLNRNVLTIAHKNPGIPQIIPTRFETRAWIHAPNATFDVGLEDRSIELTVDRYLPNAEVSEQVLGGGTRDEPAARIRLVHDDQQDAIWLFAKDPQRFGVSWLEAHILFLDAATEQQWARILGQPGPHGAGRGVVTLDWPNEGLRRDIPVPERFGEMLPIVGTAYGITFKEYFTDFALTAQGVANRSDEPNNPAVAFTLTHPDGSSHDYLTFALHPDYLELHGAPQTQHVHVAFSHPSRSVAPANSICLVRDPAGQLSWLFMGPEGEQQVEEVRVGRRATHPWLGYEVEVEAYHPQAQTIQEFTNIDDDVRAEVLHVIGRDGPHTAEAWVPFGIPTELALGDRPVMVQYRPAVRELPVTIKLLDFRKIDYPGTQTPSAFESDVEMTDAERGVILIRTISMNKPLKYRGFSFFQSSYIPGPPVDTTVLSVRNDPGIPFVYTGFIIILLGVVGMFVFREPKTVSARPKARAKRGRA